MQRKISWDGRKDGQMVKQYTPSPVEWGYNNHGLNKILLVLGRRTGADCEECEALLKKNGG
jgi:hypothetical protein